LNVCQDINIIGCSLNNNILSGILLIDCNNVSIINNNKTISNNEYCGILLVRSHYNRIINNTINDNKIGIYLNNSNNNLVERNTLLGNKDPIKNKGQNNSIRNNNISSTEPDLSLEMIIIIIGIISIAIIGSIGALVVIKKKSSISEKEEQEISEEKRVKIRKKLQDKLEIIENLIDNQKFKSAYINLEKIKAKADKFDLFDIFNEATNKIEYCKAKELEISTEIEKEEIVVPIAEIEESEKHRIFISYSTLDSEYFQISKIAKKLEEFPEIEKVLYWEVDSGENIVEYMERTLRTTNVFILFCTENSLNSKAVEDEWQAAFQLRKKEKMKIIPVFEDEEYIPYLLLPILNVKYLKNDFEEFIKKLYKEILRV